VLAEKVIAGDLPEEHALSIGRQIMRDNALGVVSPTQGAAVEAQGVKLEPAVAK